MARVKTFTNGGTLLAGDLNSIQDDYETAFSSYKVITRKSSGATSNAGGGAATWVIGDPGLNLTGSPGINGALFYLDPAEYAAGSRGVKVRLRAAIFSNAVAPGINFTFSLAAAATGVNGGSGVNPTLSLGLVGSPVAINAPPAATTTTAVSSDFTMPPAKWHVLTISFSGNSAAGNIIDAVAEILVRQV